MVNEASGDAPVCPPGNLCPGGKSLFMHFSAVYL